MKRTMRGLAALAGIIGFIAAAPVEGQVDGLAKAYVDSVRRLNEEHARRPGKNREADLARRFPAAARAALDRLLKLPAAPAVHDALASCGEAALDLDLQEDFARIRAHLEKTSPEHARKLGTALSRPRFILRGLGGLETEYLEGFAAVLDAVLDAYDEVFGFEEWSKVPGKKLRVRVHLEEKITRPPHFAPQHPYHSEIDFPVIDAKTFSSPTADGKFLFYGLCHELGHVIAMWGDRSREEDHHAWAHYTGVAIVEHLAEEAAGKPFMKTLRDVRWRSLAEERKRLADAKPSLADRDGVLAVLIALHDRVGPKAIGDALNLLDRQDRRLRVNRVRYYTFKELEQALAAILEEPERKKAAVEIIPGG